MVSRDRASGARNVERNASPTKECLYSAFRVRTSSLRRIARRRIGRMKPLIRLVVFANIACAAVTLLCAATHRRLDASMSYHEILEARADSLSALRIPIASVAWVASAVCVACLAGLLVARPSYGLLSHLIGTVLLTAIAGLVLWWSA